MSILINAAPATETETQTRPATEQIPVETLPDNPNDPYGVGHKIIEEIEEIGRRHIAPRR